jgi:hypothetical protein
MSTGQEEALEIFSKLLSDFNSPIPNLETGLRRCLLACQLLDWSDYYTFFYRELNGYPSDVPLPKYRKIKGKLIWEPDSNQYANIQWNSEKKVFGKEPEVTQEEETTLDVWSGIEWILNASRHGSREETNEIKKSNLRTGEMIKLKRIRIFSSANFSDCVSSIKRIIYDFASKTYIQLKYGNAIQDIFNYYRKSFEPKLTDLGFGNHLVEIQKGLLSENPEAWRSAAYECRSLFVDVANYLWRDPRKNYEYLQGMDGEDMKVTQQQPANRIKAYLHQKGLSGTPGKFIREEIDRLSTSIRTLFSYQSKAHGSIAREDVLSIAIFTYIILGELALRTDMEPIEQYEKPSL